MPVTEPMLAAPARLIWRTAQVRAVLDETPRVRSLVLDVSGWPGHRAGQHVDVRLTAEDGYQAQRSYSIASSPDAPYLTLTVERIDDGEVSPYLASEARVGDQFELRGPIGGYFVWTAQLGGPLFLIAGGSGIAPIMAMLRHRAAAAGKPPALLLYSSRTFEDIIYRMELEQLLGANDGLRVVHSLTRQQPAAWSGESRRIDEAMLAKFGLPMAERPLVYICGPTPLVEQTARSLLVLGYDALRVKTERFGPTGGP